MHPRFLLRALAAAALLEATALAGSFISDFSNPNQAGFTLTSNSATRPDGSRFEPLITDGHLVLTRSENSQVGTIILDDLDGGAAIGAFTARFKLQIGPGSGSAADGLAFSFGPDIDAEANFGEEGFGNGLVVSFDIYDNGGGEAPSIDVKYGGVTVAVAKSAKSDLVTGAFEEVEIQLNRAGTLNVSHRGHKVYENLALPKGSCTNKFGVLRLNPAIIEGPILRLDAWLIMVVTRVARPVQALQAGSTANPIMRE